MAKKKVGKQGKDSSIKWLTIQPPPPLPDIFFCNTCILKKEMLYTELFYAIIFTMFP